MKKNNDRKNYADEYIPSTEELMSNCNRNVQEALKLERYSFLDLFNEKKVKDRKEHHKVKHIWSGLYNNWSKWEEDQKGYPIEPKRSKNEVKGLYILHEYNKPIYVGISRKIAQRLKSHFTGSSHFQSTLVYLIQRDRYVKKKGLYRGNRATFKGFIENRESFQRKMREDWKISILPILDNYELYATEILLACELGTIWNSFETH